MEIGAQRNISFSFCLTTTSYHCSHSAAWAEDKAFPPRWINRDQACPAACTAILSLPVQLPRFGVCFFPSASFPDMVQTLSPLLITYFQIIAQLREHQGFSAGQGGHTEAAVLGLTYNRGARAPSCAAPLQRSHCSSHRAMILSSGFR